jgi:hypothetical protein
LFTRRWLSFAAQGQQPNSVDSLYSLLKGQQLPIGKPVVEILDVFVAFVKNFFAAGAIDWLQIKTKFARTDRSVSNALPVG